MNLTSRSATLNSLGLFISFKGLTSLSVRGILFFDLDFEADLFLSVSLVCVYNFFVTFLMSSFYRSR